MKKCGVKGCNNYIDDQYRFCYRHRKHYYTATCYIHGRTNFSEGKCVLCEKLKVPIYRLQQRNGKFYIKYSKTPIKKKLILPYVERLTTKTKAYQSKFISTISSTAGIYGIFIYNPKAENKLGKCLYVGQSVSVKLRVAQHKEQIKLAKKGTKNLSPKYYELAKHRLKFVQLATIDVLGLSKKDRQLLLTLFEQLAMDVFKPTLNKIAARPSNH